MNQRLTYQAFRKVSLLTILVMTAWALSSFFSNSTSASVPRSPSLNIDDQYVGSEACKDCHESQFKNYSATSHSKLVGMGSWKNKVTGCESCHGPGKAHIEEGDPTKIMSFKTMSSKQVSEICLTCHAGKEEHNNFRRGEHWRNDIGCTDCHSPHGGTSGRNLASSNTFITAANAEKPGFSTIKLLRTSDPQLCLGCHSEVKPQF